MTEPVLGTTRKGKPVTLSPRVRATHMQVIGASGTGKTKFLESLIRQDILHDQGLCLIDPTGNLYHDLVRWCETKHFFGRKKILLFDPASHAWTFGFNPLDLGDRPDEDISFFVDAMVKACAQVWGGEDTDRTPLLKRCLRITFHALAEKRLTLLEAIDLINATDPHGLRAYLIQNLRDQVVREQWAGFNGLRPRDFMEQFGSTANRLMEFLASERIRRILGQTERVIQFRSLMDEGSILLVNLSSGRKVSEDNASLLGALIINDLFLKARGRPKGSRPFYVYIDECARFINEDIGRILDEGRQFGLHLILAHQHLSQLKRAGARRRGGVWRGHDRWTKVVFGGLSPEDATTMAETLFMGEINFEEAKHSLNKPVVVGHEVVWLNSVSESSGSSFGAAQSSASGQTNSMNSSRTFRDEWFMQEELSQTAAISVGTSEQWTRGTTVALSSSTTEGRSEALKPILHTLPTSVYSLEEQLHRAAARLRNLRQQQAVVKMPDRYSVQIMAEPVGEGYASAERVHAFQEKTFEACDFVSPIVMVEKQLVDRRRRLEEAARQEAQGAKEEPESFLE